MFWPLKKVWAAASSVGTLFDGKEYCLNPKAYEAARELWKLEMHAQPAEVTARGMI